MLEWAAGGSCSHLSLLVHHTDAVREYSYDRSSLMGRLDKDLTEAARENWTVVDSAKDWNVIFPETATQR